MPPARLDASNLGDVLEANQSEKRARGFLSGQKAFSAYRSLCFGKRDICETDIGSVNVRIRDRPKGTARVDLCRNGMWITDDKNIPGFYYQFADRQPFHALLVLDSKSGGRLHELVRNAEGPLHDKLDVKQRLSKSEGRDLRKAFRQIRSWLKSHVPKLGSQSYRPDDFLALDFGQDGTAGTSRRSFWGSPVPVTRRNPALPVSVLERQAADPDLERDGNPDQRLPPRPRPNPRPILRPFFQATSIILGPNHRQIRLECQKSCKDAELRLYVDENVDATCDPLRRYEMETVYLVGVEIGGQEVELQKLVHENGLVVGVQLGNVAANESLDINVRYELPSGLLVLPKQEPALRVEVFRRTAGTTKRK